MALPPRIQSLAAAVSAKIHHLTDQGRMTLYRAPAPFPQQDFRPADDLGTTFCTTIDQIPSTTLDILLPRRGRERARAEIVRKLEAGERWVSLTQSSEPACWLWAAPGSALPGWFVPLEPGDLVIYSVFTRYQFRGRGLAPRLIHHASNSLATPGCHAVCGIALWNTPSIHTFGKLGFEPFACIQLR